MKFPYLSLHIVAFALSLDGLHAYKIDTVSCGNPGDTNYEFVSSGLTNAFAMAQMALTEVNKIPMIQPYQRLFTLLYGATAQDKIQTLFNQIVTIMSNPVGGATPTPVSDAKIYCGFQRLQPRKNTDGEGPYYDPDILEIVNEDVIAICNSVTPPTFALTYAPPNRRKFSQINLCPWFLDYATKAKFADRSSIQANVVSKLARALDGLATAILYTEVDLLSLFDKVLLHELTHTRFGGPGATPCEDVGESKGYGLKNCIRLSSAVTVPDPPPNPMNQAQYDAQVWGPEYNADTNALFGSMCGLVVAGWTVNNDGTLGKPPYLK